MCIRDRDYRDRVLDGSLRVSSWSTEQVRQLRAIGPDPADWPEASSGDLPPAARQASADEPRVAGYPEA